MMRAFGKHPPGNGLAPFRAIPDKSHPVVSTMLKSDTDKPR
jgi:hypothetical protein